MTKLRVLTIILFFTLFIVVVFFLYFNQTQSNLKVSGVKIEQKSDSNVQQKEVVPSELFWQTKENERQRILTERKKQFEIYEFAIESGKTEDCVKLVNEMAQETCIKQIALKKSDNELCKEIKNASTTERCFDEILVRMAVEKKQIELCSDIISSSLQKTCVQKILDLGISLSDCKKIPLKYDPRTRENMHEIETRDICLSQIMLTESLQGGDLESCYDIPLSASKAQCIMFLTGKAPASDDDNDGLNFYQELIAGTDPEKADTDGDGFKDGQEIEDGYNPIGPGILQ